MALPTPIGIHQIASGETYALVADLNRLGVTTDAALTFVKERAEYLTDKAVADAGAVSAKASATAGRLADEAVERSRALAQAALDRVPGEVRAEVGRTIGDTREDAAEAKATAAEAKALAVSTTAPTADAVNAVLLDDDTSAGATFANTLRRAPTRTSGAFAVAVAPSTVIGPEADNYTVFGGEANFPQRVRSARLAHLSGYDNDIWDNAVAAQVHSYHSIVGGVGAHPTVSGGSIHSVFGLYGTISGGTDNRVLGRNGAVGGGTKNTAGASTRTTLAAPLAVGDTTITVTDPTGVATGSTVYMGSGTHLLGGPEGGLERARVASVSGRVVTLDQWQATATTDNNGALTAPNGGATIARATGAAVWIVSGQGSTGATVSGGDSNTATGGGSTIAGGMRNTASALRSTISGGSDNTAAQEAATVSGGTGNTASGRNSVIGGGKDNAASADNAVIAGGEGNTVSAGGGVILGGARNTVSAIYGAALGRDHEVTGNAAIALGSGANARHAEGLTLGGGYEAIPGDAQTTTFIRRRTTTTGTIDTWGILPEGLPAGWAAMWEAQVVASSGPAMKAWKVSGLLRSTGSALVQVGGDAAPAVVAGDSALAAATLTLATGKSMVLRPTGLSGTTIRWVARFELTEVIG